MAKRKNLDDPETIKTRLIQYKERTLPLFEYYEKNNFNVNKINGGESVAKVHENILNAIK